MAGVVVIADDDAIIFINFIVVDSPPSCLPSLLLIVTAGQIWEVEGGGQMQQLPHVHWWDWFLDPSKGRLVPSNSFTSHKSDSSSSPSDTISEWVSWMGILFGYKASTLPAHLGLRKYVSAANKIKCPDNPCNPVTNERIQSCVHSHHEMLIGCFMTWGILAQVYCHGITLCSEVCWAITIITQLAIEPTSRWRMRTSGGEIVI